LKQFAVDSINITNVKKIIKISRFIEDYVTEEKHRRIHIE